MDDVEEEEVVCDAWLELLVVAATDAEEAMVVGDVVMVELVELVEELVFDLTEER